MVQWCLWIMVIIWYVSLYSLQETVCRHHFIPYCFIIHLSWLHLLSVSQTVLTCKLAAVIMDSLDLYMHVVIAKCHYFTCGYNKYAFLVVLLGYCVMLCAESSGLRVHIYVLTDWVSWSKCCFELGENLWCTYCSHRYGFVSLFWNSFQQHSAVANSQVSFVK